MKKHVLRLMLTLCLVVGIAPVASAVLLNPYYADIPPETCGPVDPYSPCYYPLGGGGTCPENTSPENCKARCTCLLKKAIEKCNKDNGGLRCQEEAKADARMCQTNCITDWTLLSPTVK